MIVQIYEVRSPDEARRLAAAGVDHVGVLAGPGRYPRELPAGEARRILEAVPPEGRRVALTLAPSEDEAAALARELRPDILHVGTAPERIGTEGLRRLRAALPGVRLMRSLPVRDDRSVALAREWAPHVDFLLLDTQDEGDTQVGATGRTHDWTLSRRIVEAVPCPVILAGGLGPENVAAAVRATGPAGVDSKTLTDRADGKGKDLEKVRAFVENARAVP